MSLRDFDPDAYKLLLAEWLRHPHARQWWGDPSANLHLAVQPEPGMRHAIILVDDRPTGYLRWQPLGRDILARRGLANAPDGVVDVGVLIGNPALRNRGIASTALGLLAKKLMSDPLVRVMVLCSPLDNAAAIRAYEKAGFIRSVQYEDPEWGPCWVMALAADPVA